MLNGVCGWILGMWDEEKEMDTRGGSNFDIIQIFMHITYLYNINSQIQLQYM